MGGDAPNGRRRYLGRETFPSPKARARAARSAAAFRLACSSLGDAGLQEAGLRHSYDKIGRVALARRRSSFAARSLVNSDVLKVMAPRWQGAA
jgi:hypothetical protein